MNVLNTGLQNGITTKCMPKTEDKQVTYSTITELGGIHNATCNDTTILHIKICPTYNKYEFQND